MGTYCRPGGIESQMMLLPAGKPTAVPTSQRLGQQIRLEPGIDSPPDDQNGPALVRDLALKLTEVVDSRGLS